MFDLVPLGLDR